MSHLLVTRPEPLAASSAARLTRLGHQVSLAPMLQIRKKPWQLPEAGEVRGYIITSQNGVMHGLSGVKDKDALVVVAGTKSAEMARGRGFTNCVVAGVKAADIVPYIRAHYDVGDTADDRAWIHLAGTHRVHNVVADMKDAGYGASLAEVYSAEAADSLPDELITSLRHNKIDAALFYSARTLTTFESIIMRLELQHSVKTVKLCMMSERVAAASILEWQACFVAKEPTEAALFALL